MPRLAASWLAAGLLAWQAGLGPVAAQSPQPPISPDKPAPGSSTTPAPPASRLDCPPGVDPNRAPTVGRDGAGSAGGTTGSATGQSLSEQLSHSGGVVCPPAGTDP
ncbi:hypothetical protein, partial [Rhodoplanes serenus]|uniref:hypothetical protein n=1 Tax=Rhodoplanes serenus TaxID=200615 RepID=UPI000DAC7936